MARSTTEERKPRRRRPRREDVEEAPDQARETVDEVSGGGDANGDEDDGDERQNGGSSGGVFAELKNVASDAALSVLAPVAKQAATTAAKYAVKKGPDLLEETVKPMLEEAGGVKGLVGKAMGSDGGGGLLSTLTGGDDDGKADAGDGTGRGRRMPIQQSVDVAAPIDIVYDQWTQFEDYPKFTHRVERVEQRDDTHVAFYSKIWKINRMWEAEIVEQRPDERIVFKSVNGVKLTGVVTFHDIAERLTRIEVNVDIDPDGPVEKIARGARFIKRAVRGDLKRFKAYVEMHEDETGAWRGEIQDGDVVAEPGEAEDDAYEEEPEAEYEDEPEAEYEDEPEAEYEDEEPEEEEEEEPEEEEERRPAKRSPSKAKSQSRSKSAPSSNGRKRGSSSTASKSKSKSTSSRSRSSQNGSSKSSSNSGSGSRSRKKSNSGSSRSKSSSSRSRSK